MLQMHRYSMIRDLNPVNILVIEADPVFAAGLSASLEQAGYSIPGIARDAEQAALLFKENEVDIIVADTYLPGDKDGVGIVSELMKIKKTPIIYLASAADAGIVNRAKQTFPAAFLIKPCSSMNVCVAIELALHNYINSAPPDVPSNVISMVPAVIKRKEVDDIDNEIIMQQDKNIFIKRNFQFIKISVDEILYMEADGNYVHINSSDKKFTIRLSLIQVMQKINYKKLVRVNRSSVVNINAIQSFNKEQVVIAQYEISIGKNYKESFFRELGFR